jgi:hypothetical protein
MMIVMYEMNKEMNLVILQRAIEGFNGVRLYLEEENDEFITQYDFLVSEESIELWVSIKENTPGAMWLSDELESVFYWEDLPTRYKEILGVK